MSNDPNQSPGAATPPAFPVYPPRRGIGDDAGIRLLIPVGRSGWAIAAGYVGLVSLTILPGPLAIILSLVAIRDIRRSRETGRPKFGMGRAVFGLIMGGLATVVLILMVINGAFSHAARIR